MPHLEATYFFSQFFWCIVMFLLTYLTVGVGFYRKYSKITETRKNKVSSYISKSNTFLKKATDIEKKIQESKERLFSEIRKLEEDTKKELLRIKEQHLSRVKDEIKKQIVSHEAYLNNLKEKIISKIESNPEVIDEKLHSYLFER